MLIKDITHKDRVSFNNKVDHPLQSYEWGEFRKKTGVKVIRKGGFQLTIHKLPYTPYTIGYLPKGPLPNNKIIEELIKIGKEKKCIFIQLEPNVIRIKNEELRIKRLGLRPSFRPLFTKYTFQLDLTKSEEELLKAMHPKTRYNIKVAQKHKVKVIEDNSKEVFEKYLKLMDETTKRQSFHAHDQKYHRRMWETLRQAQGKLSESKLSAHLFVAKYREETLAAWIVFIFHDTLYYPYGASSNKHREVMASNLMMWEVIKFGKKLGLKKFDMWGALGKDVSQNDPWFGFHKFKEGYGGQLIEFVGSYDLVINPLLYQFYKVADKIRWPLLGLKKLCRK